ncbi:ATP12 family chaperone protein [Tsuneonella mangrovi]|uniref:ATP12 family chaperone protein n=1 Tax=Tsuneonella mangrovi TaxID=1982042 RepID=UPI000BA29BDF|nr:ATP12 family protein [Tsuneonella mangrovi]
MKRFWKEVSLGEVDGGWQVALDGRPVRTQGGKPQVVANKALAELLAGEWRAAGEEIGAADFPLRDIADYAIDVVAGDREAIANKLLAYAETDTLCYRADPDAPLLQRQQAVWEPIVAAFEAREGVRMVRVSGIVHHPQPQATLDALRKRLEALDPLVLAPLEAMTSLSASLTIGLSALEPDADLEALWAAAELEERWQAELWGEDEEAAARHARRTAAFMQAAQFARAAGAD